MIKHRWRELAKSLGTHVDPVKTEQLKRTKSEIENNVTRILKLIKSEDQGKKDANRKDRNNELELVGFIENFYQQYQSLCALYDHLVGESGRIVHGRKERKGFSFSPSSSDSEYYSSEDVEVSNAKVENEHQKSADSDDLEEADQKKKSVAGREGKEAINSEYMEALRKLRREEIVDQDLKNEAHGNESSARVKELEGQLTGFKLELESLCSQKRDLEAWKEGKAAEAKQLGEKNTVLQSQVLELELSLKDKANEISDLQKKLKDNEENLTSKIESLCIQKGELEKKMASKENELLAQVKGLNDQVNRLQKDLKSLGQQKTGSEVELERKKADISEHLLQIENLKEEITKKDMVEKKMTEEGECLLLQVKDKESEVKSLRNKKKNLEKQIKSRNHETIKLRQENEGLISRIVELERTLTERGNKICELRKECEDAKNEPSTQLMALTTQVSDLKHELDSLQSKKSQLDLQIEMDSKQYLKRLNDMENCNKKLTEKISRIERENLKNLEILTEKQNQNHNLTVKISNQQRILKEQEDTIKKFSKEHKQAKIWFPESKLNLQLAERKMEELAEKYRINIEDNVRLLYQRIRVAEQIHNENKESYKSLKERYEKENRDLIEKLATYQDPARKMKEISATAKSAFDGLDVVVLKFEEGHKNFLQQISKMSNELESAKTRVSGTANEIKQLKHNVERLVVQLKDKEEEECVLKEKVLILEASASKEDEDKSNLVVSLSQLEEQVGNLERKIKDKDEDLLSLGEEKREAIRQLCVLIDHHRGRYDHLKELVSKRSAGR